MSEGWSDEKWAQHVGSDGFPDGDDMRARVINPALLYVVRKLDLDMPDDLPPTGIALLSKAKDDANEDEERRLIKADAIDNDKRRQHYDSILKEHRTLRVLDLGCGEGYLGRLLARRGLRVTYVGIDRSSSLLSEMEDRAKKDSFKAALRESGGTLTIGAAVEAKLQPDLAIADHDADLVFLVLVLEHLADEDAKALINRLAHELNPRKICIAVTLNGHHEGHREFNKSEANPLGLFDGEDDDLKVRLPWGEAHSVRIRSLRTYQRWLRDAGHVVHLATTLVDPDMPSAPPPFTLWVFSPMGYDMTSSESVANALAIAKSPLNQLRDQEDIKRVFQDARVIRVGKGAPILTTQMLGGCLYLVTKGKATAHVPNGRDLSFDVGEVFGDLEAGWGQPIGSEHFQLKTSADEKEGCTLAVVSSTGVAALRAENVHFALFEVLRDRLRRRLWLDRQKKMNATDCAMYNPHAVDAALMHHEMSLDVGGVGALVQLARMLCFAYNAQIRRGSKADSLYTRVHLSIGWADHHVGLRALVALGYISGLQPPQGSKEWDFRMIDYLGLHALAVSGSSSDASKLLLSRAAPYRRFFADKPNKNKALAPISWSLLQERRKAETKDLQEVASAQAAGIASVEVD